jgi:hypothetical protein
MTSTSASTIFQMTIIYYIPKMHKDTQITFREQGTETPKQFSQQIQNFHTKKLEKFYKSRTKFSTQFNSLM